ncbi:MAG: hypothetical protein ACRELS_02780 [Candidatus Rokuibacteriota bacterium]
MGRIVIAVVCVLLIVVGWRAPRYRSLAVGATGVLIFLTSVLAWRFLIHSETISLDRLLGRYWLSTIDVPTHLLVFFGPPAVFTALVFLLFGKHITPPAADDE